MSPRIKERINDYGMADPRLSFPRTNWDHVSFSFRPFRPVVDDDRHLHTAARIASEEWKRTAGTGLSKEMYLLAVADKAAEIYMYDSTCHDRPDQPATRSLWKRRLKRNVITKAIELAEEQQPLPVPRTELEAFVLSALNADYQPWLDADEGPGPDDSDHSFMSVVTTVELPPIRPPVSRPVRYKIMSARDSKLVDELLKKNTEKLERARAVAGGQEGSSSGAPSVGPRRSPRRSAPSTDTGDAARPAKRSRR